METSRIEKILEDLLRAQTSLCRELLELAKAERGYIIHIQLAELEKTSEKKAYLKEEITRYEAARQELMPYFKKKFSIEKEPVQLSAIIEKVAEPHAQELTELQRNLRKLFDAIQTMHEGNSLLVKRSIAFQEESFMMLYGLTKQDVRYEKNGQMTQNRKPLIDSMM
jgi:hypothetical protein